MKKDLLVDTGFFSKAIPAQSDKTNDKFWETSRENVASVESTGIKAGARTKPAISKTFI